MVDIAKFGGRNLTDLAKIMGLDVPGAGALAEDIVGYAQSAEAETGSDTSISYHRENIASTTEWDIVSKNQAYDASSLAIAAAFLVVAAVSSPTFFKGRLYMDGVMVTETVNFPLAHRSYTITGTRALSGAVICKLSIYNTDGSSRNFDVLCQETAPKTAIAHIAIGSVKLV